MGALRVAADGEGVVSDAGMVSVPGWDGPIADEFTEAFAAAIAEHRTWSRPRAAIPA